MGPMCGRGMSPLLGRVSGSTLSDRIQGKDRATMTRSPDKLTNSDSIRICELPTRTTRPRFRPICHCHADRAIPLVWRRCVPQQPVPKSSSRRPRRPHMPRKRLYRRETLCPNEFGHGRLLVQRLRQKPNSRLLSGSSQSRSPSWVNPSLRYSRWASASLTSLQAIMHLQPF